MIFSLFLLPFLSFFPWQQHFSSLPSIARSAPSPELFFIIKVSKRSFFSTTTITITSSFFGPTDAMDRPHRLRMIILRTSAGPNDVAQIRAHISKYQPTILSSHFKVSEGGLAHSHRGFGLSALTTLSSPQSKALVPAGATPRNSETAACLSVRLALVKCRACWR